MVNIQKQIDYWIKGANEDIVTAFRILMKYQLQGRYPDYNPVLPDQLKVNEYFNRTQELLKWLKMKL
jgi:hypothetical protein